MISKIEYQGEKKVITYPKTRVTKKSFLSSLSGLSLCVKNDVLKY